MSNQTHTNVTNDSQKRQRLDASPELTSDVQRESSFASSASTNVVDTVFNRSTSQCQSSYSQEFALSSPLPTSSTLDKSKANFSLLSPSISMNAVDETSMECNITGPDSSISVNQSKLLPSPSVLPSASSSTLLPAVPLRPTLTSPVRSPLSISANSQSSRNSSASRILVPSTTIKRKAAASDTLKELKRLQLLVKSKDDEIMKLTEQVEKLQEELEQTTRCSLCIPTEDAVIQWVDYLYESIHKEEIRNQLDLNIAASDLGLEREELDLCLALHGTDRISTARRLLKDCINYDDLIRREHCWQNVDENIIINICRFVREYFGVSLKFNDDYVRDSLSNMVRKDSWALRNPEKSKSKAKRASSTKKNISLIQTEGMCAADDDDIKSYNDDEIEHF